MTLDQLRTFIMVAKLRSFTRAAEALYLTQPAVSIQIEALEKEHRVKFFQRLGKKVVLTEAGEILLTAAEDILRRIEETRQALEEIEGLHRGRLSLGATLSIGIYILPEILGQFKKKYPNIELAFSIDHARRLIEQVLANSVDLGFIAEGAPIKDDRLVVNPFVTDELLVITGQNHPWAGREEISPKELIQEPFIISEEGSVVRESILRQLEAAGVRLKISMELGNIEAIKKAVEANLGVSIMSTRVVQREVEAGRLRSFRLTGIHLQRNLCMIWRKGWQHSKAAKAFLSLFAERYQGLSGKQPQFVLK